MTAADIAVRGVLSGHGGATLGFASDGALRCKSAQTRPVQGAEGGIILLYWRATLWTSGGSTVLSVTCTRGWGGKKEKRSVLY